MGAQQAKPDLKAPPVSTTKQQKGTVSVKNTAKEQKDARALLPSVGNIFTEHNGRSGLVNCRCSLSHYDVTVTSIETRSVC